MLNKILYILSLKSSSEELFVVCRPANCNFIMKRTPPEMLFRDFDEMPSNIFYTLLLYVIKNLL